MEKLYITEANVVEVLNKLPKVEMGNLIWRHPDAGKEIDCPQRGLLSKFEDGKEIVTGVVSKNYKPVQPIDAFMPVIEAIHEVTPDAHVSAGYNDRGSFWLDCLQGTATVDSIHTGYRVFSAHDGKTGINYSVLNKATYKVRENVKHEEEVLDGTAKHGGYLYVDVIGLRQVCSNGMKVRVPLDEAMVGEEKGDTAYSIREMLKEVWTQEEDRLKTLKLYAHNQRIVHMGDVQTHIAKVNEAIRAIAHLTPAIVRIVERAQNEQISFQEKYKILENILGKRLSHEVSTQGQSEGNDTIWDMVNQITHYATHKAMEKDKSKLTQKAAELTVSLGRW